MTNSQGKSLGMTQTVTVIPGDGIGPEVTEATLKILKAAGADFEYDMQLAGMSALESVKSPLPEATDPVVLDLVERHKPVD